MSAAMNTNPAQAATCFRGAASVVRRRCFCADLATADIVRKPSPPCNTHAADEVALDLGAVACAVLRDEVLLPSGVPHGLRAAHREGRSCRRSAATAVLGFMDV